MEKQQVFYIHGGSAFSDYEDYLKQLQNTELDPFAEPKQRWNRTLVEDLGDDYETFVTDFPNKYNAQYIEWKIWFEKHFEYLRDGVILLGWSQGALFLQKYLVNHTLPVEVGALILVAPPYFYFKDEQTGEDGGDFNLSNTDQIGALADQIDIIHIMHSKDDFVVAYEHAEKLKAALPQATLHTFEDKNHFLIAEFPELLTLIRGLR